MKHGGNVWQGSNPDYWLDFSANLRPEGMPDWVKTVMKTALKNVRYYPDPAMADARHGLSAYTGINENMVLPTAGGIAALDLVLNLNKGTVITDKLTFGEYISRAGAHEREWVYSANAVTRPGDTRVICNPNNPTGTVLSREKILNVHKDAVRNNGEVIVDEAFIDYCPTHSVRTDVTDGLTVIGSLTKILCVPGIRLGYVCATPKNIDRMQELAPPWQLNTLACEIAAHLPEHIDEIRKDALINSQRRSVFAEELRAIGAEPLPSQANFLLCNFGRDMTEAVIALKEKGILVRRCESFGLEPCFLRLAVRTEEENRLLIKELKKCLKS